MLGTERPVFIVGCTNSGTKCLFKPLMEHREIGGLDRELHWLGIQPNIDGRLNRLFALFPCFETNFAHVDVPARAYGGGPYEFQNVEKTIADFAKMAPEMWKEGNRLLFKDPKLSLRLTWIKKLWPDAIIMAMVRNPWSVVEGLLRRLPLMGDVPLNLDVPTATAQWINVNTVMLVDRKKIPREDFMWVRYEDLIKAKQFPTEVDEKNLWSKILAHCQLKGEGFTMPNESDFSEYKGENDTASWGKLNSWEKDFISTATGGLLEEFGYGKMPKEVEATHGRV